MRLSEGIKVAEGSEGVAVIGVMESGVAVRITSTGGSVGRGKIRTIPIWMNSIMAARAGGISIRLENRIKMMVSDQASFLEMKRGRVDGRSRVITDPTISGVRG